MSPAPGPNSSLTSADLLAMKVSAILESRPASLEVFVEHGFAPLRQPHLRAVLAPTVTLAQALRIRAPSATHEQALLDELVALFATEEQMAGGSGDRQPTARASAGTAAGADAAAAVGSGS